MSPTKHELVIQRQEANAHVADLQAQVRALTDAHAGEQEGGIGLALQLYAARQERDTLERQLAAVVGLAKQWVKEGKGDGSTVMDAPAAVWMGARQSHGEALLAFLADIPTGERVGE